MTEVVQYPADVLTGVAQEVVELDDKIRLLATEMLDVMVEQNGIGLAAPQIGVPLRIIVGGGPNVPWRFALVNPEIVKARGEFKSREGCLSFKGREHVMVPRAKLITVKGFDMSGDEVKFKASGLLGACLQHEIDHLDGVTLADHGILD